ncbi:MAG TPA: ArsR family transcriptional regulator [Dehalococcoidia bacterium]|nr:ArsR family transcriptional regulator [Dehalococcoidia bacterium]
MKGTREQALDLLRQRGELTVAELTALLGIAQPAVRRHLDILNAEGLVEFRSVRQHTGRPYFVYTLTERAREQASTGYSRLVERLLAELRALDDDSGAAGRLTETLLARMSEHLADEHRASISGETIEERAASLVATLAREGILDDFEVREDGVHLINSCCPYRRAALASEEVCRSEQRAISLLLETPVEQIGRIVDGRTCCEYLVGAVPVPVA